MILEYYRGFAIREASYYPDYGAWFSFCDYVFEHTVKDEEPGCYGFAKTIEKCKDEIDNQCDMWDEEILLIPERVTTGDFEYRNTSIGIVRTQTNVSQIL